MGFDDEGETISRECETCGHVGLQESDGFYYCQECHVQAEGLILTGVADEDFVEKRDRIAIYSRVNTRHLTPRTTPGATIGKSSLIWPSTQEQEDAAAAANNSGNYNSIRREPDYHFGSYNDDGLGPAEPEDFGSSAVVKMGYEDYYNEVRIRYVMGMQWMIKLQCEALVREFHVSPLICGVASTVWLRYVAGTRVFKDDWADRIILESELEPQPGALSMEEPEHDDLLKDSRIRYPNEPYNSIGQRAVMIWFRHLRKGIPLSCSLAIVFLACHVAREAVLPTDIIKWCIEGKLPFFAAHVEIAKRIERPSAACPISTSLMFRPYQAVPLQKLESMAATVAESIGLHLPPVNFYEIVSRYLKQLSLPVGKILPHACRLYEWSMPPDLWLSTNETRLPTRVYILSVLIVAIRILYDINGFGVWERSLSTHARSSEIEKGLFSPLKLDDFGGMCAGNASKIQNSRLDAEELLCNLEKKYHELGDAYDFAKDLPSYLQYCKDVIFAGARSSQLDPVEEELIEKLWDFYQNEKYSEAEENPGSHRNSIFNDKSSRNDDECVQNQLGKKNRKNTSNNDADISSCYDDHDVDTTWEKRSSEHYGEISPTSHKEEALRKLKLNMEENRFSYIPPRVNIKRCDYLHYVRKKDAGDLAYVAHADYYILLRACARVAQVDIRIMHIGVLSFERRLDWLERRIDCCVHLTPPRITCGFCSSVADADADADANANANVDADLVGLSQLEI